MSFFLLQIKILGEEKRGRKMKTERRVKLGNVLIFVVLFVLFVNLGCASAATTYTVCPSGCDYTSIQAAIEAADAATPSRCTAAPTARTWM